jgi:hypothetical protein
MTNTDYAERYALVLDAIQGVARDMRCDCFYPDEAEYGLNHPCAKCRLLDLLESEPSHDRN